MNLSLYSRWIPARYSRRVNRFVMEFLRPGEPPVRAHLPNPGRLDEFRFPGQIYALVATPGNRCPWRVVGVWSGTTWVLLDTHAANHVVAALIEARRIPALRDCTVEQREVPFGNSRLDFRLRCGRDVPMILEVKCCTLVHRGTALFPDAPSSRASRHLEELQRLAGQGYRTAILFLCPHAEAESWRPNVHTDLEYCRALSRASNVERLAVGVPLASPAEVILDAARPIPVQAHPGGCDDAGGYLLIMVVRTAFRASVGALGSRCFPAGYYVYVGSARQGITARIRRHQRRRKKTHWHIDCVLHRGMDLERSLPIRHPRFSEVRLAAALSTMAAASVPGFGAGDSPLDSHLFRFLEPPLTQRRFLDLLLDFRVYGGPVTETIPAGEEAG